MTRRAARILITSLGLAIAVSLFAGRDTTKLKSMTGTVRDWRPGQSISLARGPDDPGITFSLRSASYEGDANLFQAGRRVTVWYKMVGERRLLASKVTPSN